MLTELLQKLESQHGIAPSQGQNILSTIAQHIKEQFPMVGGMLDKAFGSGHPVAGDSNNNQNISGHTSSLQQLEDMVKGKLGGLLGGLGNL